MLRILHYLLSALLGPFQRPREHFPTFIAIGSFLTHPLRYFGTRFLDFFRAMPWLFAALALIGVIAVVAPWQIGVLLWSISKIALGTYLGYLASRTVLSGPRPHEMEPGPDRNAALFNRAIIVAAVILGLSLSV